MMDVYEVTEEPSVSKSKPRIQSLSDLIFGLALSIGALTLIGQKPSDFQQLLLNILYYGFSFLILINIWRSYSRTMSLLPVETERLVNLNILLLFLVSIEPYLFNQLLFVPVMTQNVSILYAFDLGGLSLIQTFFSNSLLDEKKKIISEQLRHEYTFLRNLQLTVAVIFFFSTIPVFWSWKVELSNTIIMPLRFVFWFIALIFINVFRYVWKSPVSQQTVMDPKS
jgi:uncharacterized membrane protein